MRIHQRLIMIYFFFYIDSLPSTDSRRAVVSYSQKNTQVLVNSLETKPAQEKRDKVNWLARLDLNSVDWAIKLQPIQSEYLWLGHIFLNIEGKWQHKMTHKDWRIIKPQHSQLRENLKINVHLTHWRLETPEWDRVNWQTLQTQIRRRRTWHLIRASTVLQIV